MTLDEAIEKEKEYANRKKRQAGEPQRLFIDDDREKEYRAVIAKEAAKARQRAEWLEELKEYRETEHTPSMIISLRSGYLDAHKKAVQHATRLDEYSSIGTVEECRASVEKQKAKTPSEQRCEESTIFKCKDCGYIMKIKYSDGQVFGHSPNYCEQCGQKMDWSTKKHKERS